MRGISRLSCCNRVDRHELSPEQIAQFGASEYGGSYLTYLCDEVTHGKRIIVCNQKRAWCVSNWGNRGQRKKKEQEKKKKKKG
jgi:hypothetical protein